MATKKTDLSDALKGAIEEVPTKPIARESTPDITSTRQTIQDNRKGTVAITLHTSREVRQQLKQIALDEQVTAQEIHIEAMNLLFEKYNKPPIA